MSNKLWKNKAKEKGSNEPWKLQIFIPISSPRAQGVATVGAAQLYGRKLAFIGWKSGIADLAQELVFGAVVLVEERFWCITTRAGTGVRDVTLWASADRADLLAITFFVVRDEFFVSPVLTEVRNQREFINFELLVLWGVGIIKSSLLEGNISADKI